MWLGVEMEVDKERMDLKDSSSSIISATMELLYSFIFIYFHVEFYDLTFLLHLNCTTLRSLHWQLQFKSPFHTVIVT